MTPDSLDAEHTQRQFTPGSIVFNRHELTERIAFGKRGEVWKARDPRLADMQVALKLLTNTEQSSVIRAGIDRITDLTHPNIVRTYGFTGDDDLNGFILEQVKGQPLAQMLRGKEPPFFELSEVRTWAVQLFTALQFAWEHGRVVHGDLRLANLFITTGGSLKVAEYCFSPLRRGCSLTGDDLESGSYSLPCLSPQVIAGEVPTHTDDIYAAAACLYEALTGKPVFISGNILAQIERRVPPSIAERRTELGLQGHPVHKGWEVLIARCLAKDRADRPSSAAEVLALIESLPENETRRTSSTKVLTTVLKGTAEHRSVLLHPMAIIGGVLALGALTVYLMVINPRNQELERLTSLRRQNDMADAAATPSQAADRLQAWDQFVTANALKPIPFTDMDEIILNHGSQRVEFYQTAVARHKEAEATAKRQVEETTSRLARALAAQKQADGIATFTISDRLAAWASLLKEFSATEHPNTQPYKDLLADAATQEKLWLQKQTAAKQAASAEAERMAAEIKLTEQKAAQWILDRNSAWAILSSKCVDPAIPPATKAQDIAAFLPTLANPPTVAASRAAELLSLATELRGKVLVAIEPPSSPLKPAELLAESPVNDQGPAVQRGFVLLMQERLKASGHYDGKPDGDHGPDSHGALVKFQKANHLAPTAKLDAPTLVALTMVEPDLSALAEQGSKLLQTPKPSRQRSKPKVKEEPNVMRRTYDNVRNFLQKKLK